MKCTNNSKRYQTTPKTNSLRSNQTSVNHSKSFRNKSHSNHTIKHRWAQKMYKSHQTTPKDTKPHTKTNQLRPNQSSIKLHQIIEKQIAPKSHHKTSMSTKKVQITPNHTKRHQITSKTNQLTPNQTSIKSHQIIQKQITLTSHQETSITTRKRTNHTKTHQKTQNNTKNKPTQT